MRTIDLNADLGEGFGSWTLGDDAALMDLVSSANVACGFHAGDPLIMRRTCELAAHRGVSVGAQVGYRDLAGFGRRRIDMAPEELAADVLYQIGALAACAHAAGTRVGYVKPHGALYNTVITDQIQAQAVVAAVAAHDPTLPILSLPSRSPTDACIDAPAGAADSALGSAAVSALGSAAAGASALGSAAAGASALGAAAAAAGVRVVGEFFADRAYQPDGTLVPRTTSGAVLHDPAMVAARTVRMVTQHLVVAVDGSEVNIDAASICVHGDTPGAVHIARAVRTALLESGFGIEPFVAR